MSDLREAAEMALKGFAQIHEGCGFVIEDKLHKHATDLAKLVREDCNKYMEALHQALAQPEKKCEPPCSWDQCDGNCKWKEESK